MKALAPETTDDFPTLELSKSTRSHSHDMGFSSARLAPLPCKSNQLMSPEMLD